jgi:hypothetical protein
MKTKKHSALPLRRSLHRKKVSAKVLAARKTVRRNQPLHKRFALHPVNIFAMLCVGILLATFTLNAFADSITVTAVVPAPPLTQAAVITDPTDGTQTSTQDITITGTCPDNSYINMTDNGIFVGTSTCFSGAFSIALDLYVGTNQLLPQDYNITNSAGPASDPITITYTPSSAPSPGSTGTTSSTQPQSAASAQAPVLPVIARNGPAPIATPVQLEVTQVDLSIPYISQSITPVVSFQPTLTGTAPPYSYVVVIIHSDFYTCSTYANSQGYWSCSVPSDLPSAIHTVNVSAKTPQGSDLTYPSFTIKVISANPPKVSAPSPFRITSSYSYSVETVGQQVSYNIHMTGGNPPYAYTVLWGDGKNSTIIRQNNDDFTINHTYGWINASLASKTIKVQAIDASGQSSTLQLSAEIRNPAFHSTVANITKSSGLWGLFSHARPWLWLLWPGYIIVILLVFSFWLGEREQLTNVIGKKTGKLKHHHAHH